METISSTASEFIPKHRDINTIPKTEIADTISGETSTVLFSNRLFTAENQKFTMPYEPNEIVSVFDAASFILKQMVRPCSTMKLHKLLYYSQAWNMVWEEKPLFKERIEAWANGPVVRSLFAYHRGLYELTYSSFSVGNDKNLSEQQKENIQSVLSFYGDKSAQWLIDQTHIEAPWLKAREGLTIGERGNSEITLESMYEYYSSLK